MKYILGLLIVTFFSFTSQAQNDTLPDMESYFTALIVQNIDSSIYWYKDVLGFEVLNKLESEERGFKQANLSRGNTLIELIEIQAAVSPEEVIPYYSPKTRIIGFFKTGFLVSDFDRWMAHLTRLKVHFHGEVVADNISGKKMIIVKDPDGNRIQIFEK